MRKILINSGLLLLFAGKGMAQLKPQYTQYILNNYILNPAITGIENYTDVKLSYRNQWVGIDGSPVTTYLTIHGPKGKTDYRTTATSFEMSGENPRGKRYWEEYTAAEPHHGIGGQIVNHRAGYINRFSGFVSYAYHKPLGLKTTLSAGFQAGISSTSIDRTKINWAGTDPNDPAVGYDNGELKKIQPEIGAGLWLYGANYFVGVSALNIIPGKAKFVKNNRYGTYFVPYFFATAGYRFFLNDDFSVLPSAVLISLSPVPVQVHTNVKVQYRDKLWVGGSYRFSDQLGGVAAMVGINISNKMNIGYSYDIATNADIRTLVRSTHEIQIGFLLGNKYGDSCPRNVW
jgi:type IX secretion system PorP/SprF family membrane protein